MVAASCDAALAVTMVSSTRVTRCRSAGAWRKSRVPDAKSTGTEAPRPAHDRINGRSPGSRVAARHRLPGLSQWLCGTGSPLTVAGAAAELEPWLLTAFPVRSLVRDRRSDHLTVAVGHLSMRTCAGGPIPKFVSTR